MPTPPLSDHIADQLRADSTSALAALFVVAAAHREIFLWVARAICGDRSAEPEPAANGAKARRKGDGAPPKANVKANGARKPSSGPYLARRRAKRDRDDESLLEAMRMAPGAIIGDWARAIGKSRSSTVSALHRLRDAGLAESAEGKWRLTEADPPRQPAPKWVAPVRGTDRAQQHHLT